MKRFCFHPVLMASWTSRRDWRSTPSLEGKWTHGYDVDLNSKVVYVRVLGVEVSLCW